MDSIGSFVNITQGDLRFEGCDACGGMCCNGAHGFAASPLILDDFAEVSANFPIVFSISDQRLRAFVLLNDGKGHCRFYSSQKNSCTLYQERTPACRLYPVSPYNEHIMIDTDCPSVNSKKGRSLCKDGRLLDEFYTSRLHDFPAKLEKTNSFMDTLAQNAEAFSHIGELAGLQLFIFPVKTSDTYLLHHQKSLRNLAYYEGFRDITQR